MLFSASTTHPYQHELVMFEPSVNQLKPQKEQVRFLTRIYEDCLSLDWVNIKKDFPILCLFGYWTLLLLHAHSIPDILLNDFLQ